jgi:uncharacterized protein (DUF58 family)
MPAREPDAPLLRPEDLRRIGDMDLIARWIVEGTLAGLHRSPFHGFSVEFAEYRQYAPGDDLRHLDWKAYGRSDRTYLKKFHSETNLACHVLLDGSPSMAFGDPSKFSYARALAAALIYLLLRQGDRAGLTVLADGIREQRPPGSGPRHRRELFDLLGRTEPLTAPGKTRSPVRGGGDGAASGAAPATRMAPALHDLAEIVRRRGLMVLISDLYDEEAAVIEALRHLRFRGHEVVIFHLLDRQELSFDFDELAEFQDLETGERLQVYAPSLRDLYRARMEEFIRVYREAANGYKIDYQLVDTRQPFAEVLARYLVRRSGPGAP